MKSRDAGFRSAKSPLEALSRAEFGLQGADGGNAGQLEPRPRVPLPTELCLRVRGL